MPQVEITGRADLSGALPAAEHTPENSKWGHWQVKPASVEKQMPVMDTLKMLPQHYAEGMVESGTQI